MTIAKGEYPRASARLLPNGSNCPTFLLAIAGAQRGLDWCEDHGPQLIARTRTHGLNCGTHMPRRTDIHEAALAPLSNVVSAR